MRFPCAPSLFSTNGNTWWPLCHAAAMFVTRNEVELRLFTHSLVPLRHREKSFDCSPTAQGFGNSSRLTQSWFPAALSTPFMPCYGICNIPRDTSHPPGSTCKSGHRSLLWNSPNLYAVCEVRFKSNLTLKHRYFLLHITLLYLIGCLRKSSIFGLQLR